MKFRTLAVATLAYCIASLLHFVHNGVFLEDYPNLPSWITVSAICWAWLSIASIGGVGWLLLRFGRSAVGLLFVGLYACLGFDGLAHYGVAPIASHTLWMNATIGLEVLTAAILLYVVASNWLSYSRLKAPAGNSGLRTSHEWAQRGNTE